MKVEDCKDHAFWMAVHSVFVDNHLRYENGDSIHKAKSERWTSNSSYRKYLWENVRDRYCDMTGCKDWHFWYSEDGVAEAYLRMRKAGEQDREDTMAILRTRLPL